MTKLTWNVEFNVSGLNVTSKILSMSIRQGREKYLDSYSGGFCTLTIDNRNNFASNFVYGTVIRIQVKEGSGPYITGMYFAVQEVTFDDYPGNTGLPTATIVLADHISRAGRVSTTNYGLPQEGTGAQLSQLAADILPPGLSVSALLGNSTASAITYSGTFTNYMNYLVATERGFIYQVEDILYFVNRNSVSNRIDSSYTYGPTTSSTQIAYQTFERIQNGLQFINNATISSAGVADQTATNTASVTSKGAAFYSSTTVDATTTQALGNANWIVNTFSDPDSLRFTCTFTDLMQLSSVIANWLASTFDSQKFSTTFNYQIPGGALTSIKVLLEGYEINVTPSQTTFTLFLSPLTYYQFFTLDSTTLGILDTSRLGW